MSVGAPSCQTTPSDTTPLEQHTHGFEGAEKLLEVWFVPPADLPSSSGSTGPESEDEVGRDTAWDGLVGLRRIPGDVWQQQLLDHVRCQILSSVQSTHCTAYLLSESSLFVFPYKIILKTCGTTTLLRGLQRLLDLAAERCGLRRVWRLFYSRKAFMFPERQSWPHCAWQDEVNYLDAIYDHGSAYIVGKLNGDHWNLYLTAPADDAIVPAEAAENGDALSPVATWAASSTSAWGSLKQAMNYLPAALAPTVSLQPPRLLALAEHDCTLEIIMTHLDLDCARKFYLGDDMKEGNEWGQIVTDRSGIRDALPTELHTVDAYQFGPCGFSLNAIGDNASYATIHVTPEPQCSYASFECNLSMTHAEMHECVAKIVRVFGAGHVSVTIFRSEEGRAKTRADQPVLLHGKDDDVVIDSLVLNVADDGSSTADLRRWQRVDRIVYELQGYTLGFVYFEKQEPTAVGAEDGRAAAALHAATKKRAFARIMGHASPASTAVCVAADDQADMAEAPASGQV